MKKILITLAIAASIILNAQYDPGELPFTYINIAVSPISSALSMSSAAAYGNHRDIFNPASVCFNTSNDLYISYTSHIASSHLGYFEFNTEDMRYGIKYFNSGQMEQRDSLDNYIGNFSGNVLLGNVSYGHSIDDKIKIGASALIGLENILDYNQFAGAISAGIIYKLNDIVNFGLYAGNIGAAYKNGITLLPARIIGGIRLGNETKPITLYADAGKILDSDYFYSIGIELNILQMQNNDADMSNNDIESEAASFVIDKEIEEMASDTLSEKIVEEMSSETDEIISEDNTEAINETIAEEVTEEVDNETEKETEEDNAGYLSYADYLEQLEKTEEETENIENVTNSEKEYIIEENKTKEKTFVDQLGFVIRGGISSDKQMLYSGTSLDLVAGLSAGFGLSYMGYEIDYAAKFWGELGIAHSIGIKVEF